MSAKYVSDIIKSFIPDAFKNPVRDVRESFHRILSPIYYRNVVDSSARLHGALLDGHVLVGANTTISGNVKIGKYTTLNDECLLSGGTITIGNYCQFGPRVAVYAVNHSLNHLTTYNNRSLFDGALKEHSERADVEIGNDVWLGHGALVMPGVSLGTGCVIGAGSVVTKPVPPYAVAAGCPAVVKRFRVPKDYLALLLESHWWYLEPKELADFRDVFTSPLEHAPKNRLEELSRLGAERARTSKRLKPF